jgi:hypothetical protein
LFRLNIVESIRREFWEYFDAHKSEIALHSDFHHLTSSQAFAFNAFFPFVGLGASSAALLTALGVGTTELRGCSFEAVPDREEGTSIDVYAECIDGSRLLIEVKLTENGFGGGVPNDRRGAKLRDIYGPRLRGKTNPGCLDEAQFFPQYQLFRNVSHLDLARGDRLILVVPRANTAAWRDGERFLESCLSADARHAVRLVPTEELCAAIDRTAGVYHGATGRGVLTEKYVLAGA